MGKLDVKTAIEWAKKNDVFDEKVYQRESWVDSIFLLWGVTDYINLYFEQDFELKGSDLIFSITDEHAHNDLDTSYISDTYKGKDKGIDAIVLIGDDDQLINSNETPFKTVKDIVVFQGKNRKRSQNSKIEEVDFKHAANGLNELLTMLLQKPGEAEKALAGKFISSVLGTSISTRIYGASIHSVYLTAVDATVHEVENVPNWIKSSPKFSFDAEMIPVEEDQVRDKVLVTLSRLEDLLEEKRKSDRDKAIQIETGDKILNTVEFKYEQFYSERASAYQGMVYLKDYAKFLENHDQPESFDEQIIADNVRGKKGDGLNANKSMRATLSADVGSNVKNYIDFWWLNNGITIIASSVEQISPREVRLSNPQIVNGQQTSRQIFDLRNNIFNPEWKLKITFIIIPDNDEMSNEIKKSIIIGVNTQTPVTISNTMGLNNEIRRLSGYIRKVSNDEVVMDVKSEKSVPNAISYPYEFLIQMIVAGVIKKPGEARRGISTLVRHNFETIFSKENTKNDTEVINIWIKFIHAVDTYDSFWKMDWKTAFGVEKDFSLGDNYGYLGIFTCINKAVEFSDNDDVSDTLPLTKLSEVYIDKDNFSDAVKNWHTFMADHKNDPDGYTKSTKFSEDLRKFMATI